METCINFNEMEITRCANFNKIFSLLHLMIAIYWSSHSRKFQKLFYLTNMQAAFELKIWQIHYCDF